MLILSQIIIIIIIIIISSILSLLCEFRQRTHEHKAF